MHMAQALMFKAFSKPQVPELRFLQHILCIMDKKATELELIVLPTPKKLMELQQGFCLILCSKLTESIFINKSILIPQLQQNFAYIKIIRK